VSARISAQAFITAAEAGFDHLMAKAYAFALLAEVHTQSGESLQAKVTAMAAISQLNACPYSFSCLFDYNDVTQRLNAICGNSFVNQKSICD
jgi:hypothetical protein